MATKIEQDYEEGLKFLITDTGEDANKTAEAEKKVTTFLMIQEWRDRASKVENGADVYDFMNNVDIDSCLWDVHKLVKKAREADKR